MIRADSKWWSQGFTAEWWEALDATDRATFLDTMDDRELEDFSKDWRVWGRDNQLAPEGVWDTWLALAGRGWGKTRSAVEFANDEVEAGRATRLAIVGQGDEDIRRVMIEGQSGFLKTAKSWNVPRYFPSRGGGILEWPNGAVGFVYSAQDTEGLRGPEFDFGWFDEPMAVPAEFRQRTMDNLEFCLRLPPHPRLVITTTPKPHRWLREEMARAELEMHKPMDQRSYVVTRGITAENRANLATSYYRKIMNRFDNTQVGRQELYAEILGEEAGALWTSTTLDKTRVRSGADWSEDERLGYNMAAQSFARGLERVVIGVDPNTKTASNHAAGIIPVGRRPDGFKYCLGDWSAKNKSPAKWAEDVMRCAQFFDADEIVAEVNNGGEMIRDLCRQASVSLEIPMPAFRMEHAKRDKIIRATPIASEYELKRAGQFGECGHRERPGPLYLLELQMGALHEGHDGTGEDFDRVDALVWGMSRLGRGLDNDGGGTSGMMSFDQMAGA